MDLFGIKGLDTNPLRDAWLIVENQCNLFEHTASDTLRTAGFTWTGLRLKTPLEQNEKGPEGYFASLLLTAGRICTLLSCWYT